MISDRNHEKIIKYQLSGSLSQPHGMSLGCQWRRQSPDMEGSCKYIECAVTGSWQRVVLQLGSWARG